MIPTILNKATTILGRVFLPKVRNLMISDCSTLDVGAPLMDVIQVVMKEGVPSVIITEEGKPIGIITRRDLLGQCFFQKDYTEKTTAGDIMTHPLITIGSNESVLKAYELMVQKGVRGLVVLEGEKIVGGIRLDDIKHLASETPITVFYRIGYFFIGVLVTLVVVALALAL